MTFHAGDYNCTALQLLVAEDFLQTKVLNGRDSVLDISMYTRFHRNQNILYIADIPKLYQA